MTTLSPKLSDEWGKWNYYVGDPCYVIDDERWGDFCDALFKNQHPYDGCIIDWEIDGEKYEVEVWDSPHGDGCWPFHDSVRYGHMNAVGGCGEMGVDAGLLAVVPRECCDPKEGNPAAMGILFDDYPDLETNINGVKGDCMVVLNDCIGDDYYECTYCGDPIQDYNIMECGGCGYGFCYGCGCNDCEECGNCGEWDNGWGGSNCSCCSTCGEQCWCDECGGDCEDCDGSCDEEE